MEIIQGTTDFQLHNDTALAMGKFDGVHIGHQRLLAAVLDRKRRGLKACVFTFHPAPAAFFGLPDGGELSTAEEKRRIFARMGVDILIEFPFNERTAVISPEEFTRRFLGGRLRAKYVAAGEDISFGRGGAGNAALLRDLCGELSFEVEIVPKVCVGGESVSSSRIRACVNAGRMEEATELLGMPYMVSGTVISGKRFGRTLDFPTANFLPGADKLLPPKGVYYSRARLGETVYPAITNVGCKPTVSEEGIVGVESYLYDFDGDLYGGELEVELLSFCRPERRFANAQALRGQLAEDVRAGERYHAVGKDGRSWKENVEFGNV